MPTVVVTTRSGAAKVVQVSTGLSLTSQRESAVTAQARGQETSDAQIIRFSHRAHEPMNFGLRFCMKALAPSL
jgi:hypothetical protein